ncbi:hypothetical protein T484DRAFT_1782750 [Baffinella frigidus]|nr:hypothetical protein T484DRAFT_1782750 [Cryptophyta sp. CCMP2293]
MVLPKSAVADVLRHGVLSTILGLRNGLEYGVKVRAPHSLVMAAVFKNHLPIKDNILGVIKMSFAHARNLGAFVLIYKGIISLLRALHEAAGLPVRSPPGRPAEGWHALLAGWIGGQIVWAKHSSVNEQIALYLLSRVTIAAVKLLAKGQVQPFCKVNYAQAYPYFAAGVWAAVMWLFEMHPKLLQPSLEMSMRSDPIRTAGFEGILNNP